MIKHNLDSVAKRMADFSEADAKAFLQAFFTPKELEILEGRVNLVSMLLQGASQREIVETLGVSFSQINRGSHELQYGTGKKFFPLFFSADCHPELDSGSKSNIK